MTDLTNEPVSGLVERVLRYLRNSLPAQPVRGFPAADANDALAELEHRLERAERERDDLRQLASPTAMHVIAEKVDAEIRVIRAEALVGELREALEIAPPHPTPEGRAIIAAALAKTERDGERS